MALAVTPRSKIPKCVLNDLSNFISVNYSKKLPNSLLIAQTFIMKYPSYGREYGLAAINKAIEENDDFFNI
jgi:hypothetical protein